MKIKNLVLPVLAACLALGAALQQTAGQATAAPRELALPLPDKRPLKLVLIPAGKFMMGATRAEWDGFKTEEESPQHEVVIHAPFYIGVTPVTQEQYCAVMGDVNTSVNKGATNPVDNLSWKEATAFCNALSLLTHKAVRLPTEAEWEYASRAGSTTKYFFGDSESMLGDYAWYQDNGMNMSHPVGLKKPNAWGLYDMYGNVQQWCLDWYTDTYEPGVEPSTTFRTIRGSCWWAKPWYCRSAVRNKMRPGSRDPFVGFRIVVAAN